MVAESNADMNKWLSAIKDALRADPHPDAKTPPDAPAHAISKRSSWNDQIERGDIPEPAGPPPNADEKKLRELLKKQAKTIAKQNKTIRALETKHQQAIAQLTAVLAVLKK